MNNGTTTERTSSGSKLCILLAFRPGPDLGQVCEARILRRGELETMKGYVYDGVVWLRDPTPEEQHYFRRVLSRDPHAFECMGYTNGPTPPEPPPPPEPERAVERKYAVLKAGDGLCLYPVSKLCQSPELRSAIEKTLDLEELDTVCLSDAEMEALRGVCSEPGLVWL